MAKTPKACVCGCTGMTRGGDFLPGHDAKYKSHLLAEARSGTNPEAVQVLQDRGWLHFLNTRAARVSVAPTSGAVTHLRASQVLNLMKAAAKVLRWTNQYKRGTVYSIHITAANAASIASREHLELRLPTDGSEPEPFSNAEQEAIDHIITLAKSATVLVD